MAITKYASLEHAQVLELRSAPSRVRHASLGKLADFHQYRTDDGFLYARIRAISSRVNKNHDGWPSIELAGGQDVFDRHTSSADGFTVTADGGRDYGFSTFLGKPIFVDHHNGDPARARGVIVDAKLHVDDHRTASLDSYYSSPDADPEHLPGTWVELLLEVDAKAFPKFAKAIVEGSRNPKKGIDGWSMGCDVEKSVCSICKNAAAAPDDYCQHVRMKGAIFDYTDPKSGRKTSKRAYENCYGIKFFEISGVFDPADETALSLEQARTSKSQSETITQDPKEKGLKDLADEQAEELLDESGRKRKKDAGLRDFFKEAPLEPGKCHYCRGLGYTEGTHMDEPCSVCQGSGKDPDAVYAPEQGMPVTAAYEDDSGSAGGAHYDGQWECPDCGWGKYHLANEFANSDPNDASKVCSDCGYRDALPAAQGINDLRLPPGGGTDGVLSPTNSDTSALMSRGFEGHDPSIYGPVHQGRTAARKLAENPLPQSEMSHAPEHVDTLREEEVCPVCGSSMDEDTCDVCGYQEPPDGFDNPDLTKAQGEGAPEPDAGPETAPEPHDLGAGPGGPPDAGAVNTPTNPTALAHVTRDMEWDVPTKTSARINKVEQPLVSSNQPQTNEPQEKILSDQLRPVTSRVRTAEEFIAAAGATRRNTMNHTADAASGAPAVAKPDVHTDVTGVGGVDQASNDAASKADAQVDVLAIGGTGVESVSAEKEGVNVEQGDEHSKNIEAIHTDTWSTQERQHTPVTTEVPSWVTDSKWSHWHVEGHEDGPLEAQEQQGGATELQGGGAVKGVKPIAEQFGDRVDLLQHVTSPSNNSGPTKTWNGTDGNGVLKQQDPVTNESIALAESGLEGKPNWTSSTHIFAAFKLADLEVELGLTPADLKYERAAELERETPTVVEASLKYAQRLKTAAARKTAGVQKLPVMGRSTTVEKEASVEADSPEDGSFMFGGL